MYYDCIDGIGVWDFEWLVYYLDYPGIYYATYGMDYSSLQLSVKYHFNFYIQTHARTPFHDVYLQ